MCLIVYKPNVDAKITLEEITASVNKNSDGSGIIYIEEGRIKVEKVMGTKEEQVALWTRHKDRESYVLHHRMATAGEKSEYNIHPFKVLSIDEGDAYDLFFAHNGCINMSKFSDKHSTHDKRMSDTHMFAAQYLTPVLRKCPDLLDEWGYQAMIHDFLGYNNKLVFLRNDGRSWIFNKSQGEEHNGCWISNKHSIAQPYKPPVVIDNYAKRHGSHYNNFNYYNNNENSDLYSEYEDGVWYRDKYNTANRTKTKLNNNESGIGADEILTAIEEYHNQPRSALLDLAQEEPKLCYDLLNFMNGTETLAKSVLDEPADAIAQRLWDAFFAYSMRKAKAA